MTDDTTSAVREADNRPANCRFRLQDEGKPYPRSRCNGCGKTAISGLGAKCSVAATPTPTVDAGDDELMEQRDRAEAAADRLSAAIAAYFGLQLPDHSNLRCPWGEAAEHVENATPPEAEAGAAWLNVGQWTMRHDRDEAYPSLHADGDYELAELMENGVGDGKYEVLVRPYGKPWLSGSGPVAPATPAPEVGEPGTTLAARHEGWARGYRAGRKDEEAQPGTDALRESIDFGTVTINADGVPVDDETGEPLEPDDFAGIFAALLCRPGRWKLRAALDAGEAKP